MFEDSLREINKEDFKAVDLYDIYNKVFNPKLDIALNITDLTPMSGSYGILKAFKNNIST